ncbi:MAG: hypothetical protein ACK5S6_01390 [bacterium]|jgi:hypothetical protein
MPIPKIILTRPHIDIVGSDLERCVDYRLSESVEGISTGDVGYVPADNLTNADVLEHLKQLVVDDINSLQTTYTFTLDEVVSWECLL